LDLLLFAHEVSRDCCTCWRCTWFIGASSTHAKKSLTVFTVSYVNGGWRGASVPDWPSTGRHIAVAFSTIAIKRAVDTRLIRSTPRVMSADHAKHAKFAKCAKCAASVPGPRRIVP
jgi:hypothetical protein